MMIDISSIINRKKLDEQRGKEMSVKQLWNQTNATDVDATDVDSTDAFAVMISNIRIQGLANLIQLSNPTHGGGGVAEAKTTTSCKSWGNLS